MTTKKRDSPENPKLCALPGRKRRIRLQNAKDAVRFLGRVVNDLVNEEIDVDRARAIVYALSTLAKLHEQTELETRLSALELRLK